MQKISGKEIVERIDDLLKKRNEKRKALCDAIGISVQPITSWTHRNSLPSLDIAYKIAQYFDVSMDWLLTGKDRDAPPKDVLDMAYEINALPKNLQDFVKNALDTAKHLQSGQDGESLSYAV